MTLRIGLLASRIRTEEKMLIERMRDRTGVEVVRLDPREIVFDVHVPPTPAVDVLFDRTVAATHAQATLPAFERHGIPTVNTSQVTDVCSDKWRTSLALAQHDVPTPRTVLATSPESALRACDDFGYPVVMKPVQGSWARMVSRLDTRTAAEAVIEHKEVLGHPMHHLYYVQEYIDKPGRDIRSFVIGDECIAAIYRTNESHWLTNTALGAQASNCPVTDEIRDISLRAAEAVGGGMLAIDLMETPQGLTCHEVNDRMEFRNSVTTTGVDIPGRMIDFVIQEARQ